MSAESVKYNMPKENAEYLLRVLGEAKSTPVGRQLMDAMHHVLAGGVVKVEIEKPGDATTVAQLEALRVAALRHSNAANAASGTYLTTA